MITLAKEFYMAASLAYHELALTQMGPTHRDYPQVLLHVSDLRHRLQAIRSKLSKGMS